MLTGMWFTVLLALAGLSYTQAHKWGYDDDSGPHHWPSHFPESCSGKSQSPIDIKAEETLYSPKLKDFAIWYDPPRNTKLYIKNNGHTAQVDIEGDYFVTNGDLPNIYKSFQFHFHWGHHRNHGSEHTLEGKAYPLELHLVNYNSELYKEPGDAVDKKGGLAVLGVFYEVAEEDNPAIDTVIRGLRHVKLPVSSTRVELPNFSIRDLLPNDMSRYFRYNGSLTTPNCLESVIWTVFANTQTISERQIGEFRKLLQTKHKKGNKRHRRSLSKAQLKLERDAEEILDELSIHGSDFERASLKSKVLQELMSDMPQPDSSSGKSQYKPRLDEEKASKIDKHVKSEGGNSAEEKHHKATSSEHATDGEAEHEVMVNNFRPPQPLHERVVYRSFKLSAPYKQDKPEPEEDNHHMAMKEDRGNSSGQTAASLSVLLIAFIFRIIF